MTILELADIQANIVQAAGHLKTVRSMFFRLGDRSQTRAWLADLVGRLTSADDVANDHSDFDRRLLVHTVNVAFTATGLRRAGLGAERLRSLPTAFNEGMRARADLLGDAGSGHPENWEDPWRTGDPDVLVTVRWRGDVDPADDERRAAEGSGMQCMGCMDSRVEDFEPFGYRDGISAPSIAGSGRATKPGNGLFENGRWRAVRPGEFLLGYPDEFGETVSPSRLSAFTRNGSFMVWRKLYQDVEGFHAAVGGLARMKELPVENVYGALMGRRRDGQPLIGDDRHSIPQTDEKHNGFLYADDPEGHLCPLGSHIRRANPRDGLDFGTVVVKRHLMIRRGTTYGSGADTGLIFSCFVTDIARQFEFVQRRWLNEARAFRLQENADPIAGCIPPARDGRGGRTSVRYYTQDGPKKLTIGSFVTLRGGAYFFTPGLAALRWLSRLPDSEVQRQ